MDIMNGAFEFLIAPIYRYEGTLARLMGDAILAFFGAPLSHENDAELACRAALDIVAGAKDYAAQLEREWGLSGFNVRVGINTGLVVVGEVGADMRVEYTAMGEAINLASRMEQAATPGSILITHDTYQLVRGLFDVQAQEPFNVKGRLEPVQAYQVLRSRPRGFRMGTRGVEGVTTSMVGREAELLGLQKAFQDVVEEGLTRVVTVVGEAGLGKSRLLYEFEGWVAQQPQEMRYFRGRAGLEMQHIPYALLRDMFSLQFQVQDSDPTDVARGKIEQGLCQVLGCDEAGQMKAHFVGQLVGFDFGDSPHLQGVLEDPQQLRDRALLYLDEYLSHLVDGGPVLLFLEDIHWADDSSLDTVNQLAAALASRDRVTPFLVICLTRPVLYERRELWGEGQTFHTRLALRPLSRRDSRRLVEELLQRVDQLPDTLRDLIIEQSEGTPFYVEELIRMLIEDGIVVKGDHRWRVELERLADLRVPPTLTGILQARLDSLQIEERTTLQQAAVMGRVFWDDAVCQLNAAAEVSVQPDQVAEVLTDLRGREMILRREQSSFAGVNEYAFKHATLREVTYEGMLKRLRRKYHALVADWLLARSGERAGEYTGLVAEHLDLAGQRGEAADYLRRAGEQAAARYANAEAADYFSRAIQLIPETDSEALYDLLSRREHLYDLLGARETQLQDIVALEALADILADDSRRAEAASRRAAYYEAVSNFPQAAKAAQAAVAQASLAGDPRLEVGGRIVWARALMRQGQFPEAIAQLEPALALAQEVGDRDGEASSRHYLGTVKYFLGDYPTASKYLEQAREIRRALGDRRGEGITLNNLGGVYHAVGDYARGKAVAEQALAVYQAIGDRRNEAQTLGNLGSFYYALGELSAARDHHVRAQELFIEIGDRRGAAIAAKNLGLVLYDLQDYDNARRHCDEALEITRAIGDRAGEGYALSHLALVLEKVDLPAAAAVYEQSLQLRRAIGQGASAVDDLAGLARVSLSQGQLESALAFVEEALAWIAAHGVNGIEYPLRVYLTAADVLGAAGRPEQADEVLAAARSLLQEQAARISDERTRRGFIERVPLHRQVQERTEWIDPAACA
jgi:tetratricopeptide (TPR) repeat protein